jgi:hypothetical protein
MEFYLPSLFIIIFAAIISFAIVPRFTPMILALFASLCLVIAVYNHSSLFYDEYKNMNWANTATASMASPYLLVGLVIILSIGYILFLVSSGQTPSLSMPSSMIPYPSTATNFVTRGIGNALVNSGMANTKPANAGNARANNGKRDAFESVLSKAV